MSVRKAHYVARIANEICEHIADGLTLQQALKKIGYLAPSQVTVFRWLDAYPDFRERYERARQLQADVHADGVVELGQEVLTNPKAAPAFKVAADILRWSAEVRNKSRYGKAVEPGKDKPLDPAKIREEIKRLEAELGIAEKKVVPLKAVGGDKP